MNRALALADRLCGDIARHGVQLDPRATLDRGDAVALARPGRRSANRHARLVRAQDGWLAVNLARGEDIELVPAWLGRPVRGDAWSAVTRDVRGMTAVEARDRAALLGLPVSIVGEAPPRLPKPPVQAGGHPRAAPRVLDLSSLWAGPLCGAILAAAGAAVTKIESAARPDTTARSAPALDQSLNGAKARQRLDFAQPRDRARLAALIAEADVLITSARARAFVALGLDRDTVLAANPALIWVAVSGHGWDSPRVAFGDDAAAAGGLVRWSASGAPEFLGDAVADPLTGLAAAAAVLGALAGGASGFIDAAMAGVAASAP
ncbi:CoA transferase [Sphingomonas immobilis]|uniref:CoA transferase n=1 Tax=Sphingomonas immobilis TaxID=3063997 RepID=A0ABT8ZXF5_9SPHN|nr:CoA transferase [Sphingomonas sp. CA1-15]MDO7842249.1 CoA transferase [Sphingomonas sp. CA1-15]